MYSESMEWLNYHHLLYFWTVAKEGSIAKACEKLRLAQPTISGQIRSLEASLGERLFTKTGRHLVLTDVGQLVYRYAEEIFSLGLELQDVLKGRPRGRPLRLLVGISDFVPKLVALRILRPALEMPEPVQMVCDEDVPEHLLAELAAHRLDVVLSDTPVPPTLPVKAYNHLLGRSPITLFAAPKLAARYRKNFPSCLDAAPFLVPMEGLSLRRELEHWFDSEKIRPRIVAEFKDRALMTVFGQAGLGIFAAPSAIENEIRSSYGIASICRVDSITESFYAISIERKLKHPAIVRISQFAREELFASASNSK